MQVDDSSLCGLTRCTRRICKRLHDVTRYVLYSTMSLQSKSGTTTRLTLMLLSTITGRVVSLAVLQETSLRRSATCGRRRFALSHAYPLAMARDNHNLVCSRRQTRDRKIVHVDSCLSRPPKPRRLALVVAAFRPRNPSHPLSLPFMAVMNQSNPEM